MKDLLDKVVAVTGAASGIGRALALRLALEGCRLSLSDVDSKGLEETRDMLGGGSEKVATAIVDVSDKEQVYDWANRTAADFGRVDMVINNAGVTASDTLADITYDDFEWVFNIDFWGVVYGTRAFLPHLLKRPEAHIVNVSSINGIMPFPYNGPYNCAKFAVKGFNETLMIELRDTSVHVSSVHPGGVKTNITRNMRFTKVSDDPVRKEDMVTLFDKVAKTTSEQAAGRIVKGIRGNKKKILVGMDAKIIDLAVRIMPLSAIKMAGKQHSRLMTIANRSNRPNKKNT